jgi:hypothetical protein
MKRLDNGATIEYVADAKNGDFYRACYKGRCRCAEDEYIATLYAHLLVKKTDGIEA